MSKKALIIGSGFAGLSAAACLAKAGLSVEVYEKNDQLGGRARMFETHGFKFDMGPSWYWMPDVFEQFFSLFGKKSSDYFTLKRLDPSYQVFFEDGDPIGLPAGKEAVKALFEGLEPGSGPKLESFLSQAAYKYKVGMEEFVFKPGHSLREFADWRVVKSLFQLQMFTSIDREIKKLFRHPKLIRILQFPVLFLGARPQDTPAMYSLMNYSDICQGTWYPEGGMHEIVKAMVKVCEEAGVKFHTGKEVQQIVVSNRKTTGIRTQDGFVEGDVVLGAADYNHIEQVLLEPSFRTYSPAYWDKRTMAPSSLLFYLGINKKVPGLLHHNLFFDESLDDHAIEIYKQPAWPKKPLFYVCCPSKTDVTVAPEGHENVFILIPLAPGLKDDESKRAYYFDLVMARLERHTGTVLRDSVIYNRSYAMHDFQKDYHAFKGNAYGLANTLLQTAFLKPKMRSRKVKNLFYTGQLTTPGPGVPPSLISGQVAAREIIKTL